MKKVIECIYQDEIYTNVMSKSKYLPSKLLSRPDLRFLSIVTDDAEGLDKIISTLGLPGLSWIGFLTSNIKEELKAFINPIDCRLSWYQKQLLRSLGPVGNYSKSLYYVHGDLSEVIECVIDDAVLWDGGAAVVLPIIEPIENKLKFAINMQLRRKLINNFFDIYQCIILSNNDGDGCTILWSRNWSYSDSMSEWAHEVLQKYHEGLI
jgi:hypothetical protein